MELPKLSTDPRKWSQQEAITVSNDHLSYRIKRIVLPLDIANKAKIFDTGFGRFVRLLPTDNAGVVDISLSPDTTKDSTDDDGNFIFFAPGQAVEFPFQRLTVRNKAQAGKTATIEFSTRMPLPAIIEPSSFGALTRVFEVPLYADPEQVINNAKQRAASGFGRITGTSGQGKTRSSVQLAHGAASVAQSYSDPLVNNITLDSIPTPPISLGYSYYRAITDMRVSMKVFRAGLGGDAYDFGPVIGFLFAGERDDGQKVYPVQFRREKFFSNAVNGGGDSQATWHGTVTPIEIYGPHNDAEPPVTSVVLRLHFSLGFGAAFGAGNATIISDVQWSWQDRDISAVLQYNPV